MPDQHIETAADLLERPPAAIRFIGDLARIVPGPDDLFVLTTSEELEQDALVSIVRSFEAIVPGVRILVMAKGMTLEVIDKAAALARLERATMEATP